MKNNVLLNKCFLSFPRKRESSLSAVWRDITVSLLDSRFRGNENFSYLSLDIEMRKNVFSFLLGFVFLLISLFFDTASSPDYHKILKTSVIVGILSAATSLYLLVQGKGYWRVLSAISLLCLYYIFSNAATRLFSLQGLP